MGVGYAGVEGVETSPPDGCSHRLLQVSEGQEPHVVRYYHVLRMWLIHIQALLV